MGARFDPRTSRECCGSLQKSERRECVCGGMCFVEIVISGLKYKDVLGWEVMDSLEICLEMKARLLLFS